MSVDVAALERNVMRRIERAQLGASVGELNDGRDSIDDVLAREAQHTLELDLIDETSPAEDHVVVAEWTRRDGGA